MLNRISNLRWKIWSGLVYPVRFGAFGARSSIRRPIALINAKQIRMGSGCFVRDGARMEVVNRPGLPKGELHIGNNVTIEQFVHIIACDRVIIEDEVCITPRCSIVDATHPIGSPEGGNRSGDISQERSFVHLKRRVFLGANVVVLPNVTIGENTIVGANSVVTSDLPANCVAAGAPAKVIKYF